MKNNKIFDLGMILSALIFIGCNDTNLDSTKDKIVGQLIDSAVIGVGYECANNNGFTKVDGNFTCDTLPISFYIGGINLGGVSVLNEDRKVFPQDIARVSREDVNNSEVIKIALLLQSLDDDGNASNGINITAEIHELFDEEFNVADLNMSQLKAKLKEKKPNINFIDVDDVIEHLSFSTGITTNSLEENSSTENTTMESNSTVSNDETQSTDSSTSSTIISTPTNENSLVDSSNNTSSTLTISSTPDTIPPAQNSTIDNLVTDDTTPALSGNLPSGENDRNTTNYVVKIKIADDSYTAINNKNGKWSIADNTISTLDMGFHDVNITVSDEANNTSSTFLSGKIEIDNTGFLIDSALEGIKYVSGTYIGYTDKDGLFKYDKGSGVTFYVGEESTGISLGTATQKIDPHNANRRIITLFDLAGSQDENNPKVINMGKFLQSLDSDNDVSNGISIDERTKESITLLGLKNRIDFNMNVEDFHAHNDIYELFNDLAGHFGEHRGLVDTEDAKAHMVAIRDNNLSTKSYAVTKVSGETEAIKVLGGVFKSIGGVVEGLEYRSGNQFGRTDVNGAYKYEEGKKVKFYIYQLELGITEAKAMVTPADLVPSSSFNHPKPRNIIRLLNAFDAPASANILIDNAVREALEKYRSQIDINLPDGKANAELSIPQGEDEFGAQFEDFEMGKDILDEIDSIRGEA